MEVIKVEDWAGMIDQIGQVTTTLVWDREAAISGTGKVTVPANRLPGDDPQSPVEPVVGGVLAGPAAGRASIVRTVWALARASHSPSWGDLGRPGSGSTGHQRPTGAVGRSPHTEGRRPGRWGATLCPNVSCWTRRRTWIDRVGPEPHDVERVEHAHRPGQVRAQRGRHARGTDPARRPAPVAATRGVAIA